MANSIHKVQRVIGIWADNQFQQSTPRTILNHMKREFKELDDIVHDDTQRFGPAQQEELADIFILGFHLAHRAGFNLENAIIDKFNKNVEREWGEPDSQGVTEHVRTDEELLQRLRPASQQQSTK